MDTSEFSNKRYITSPYNSDDSRIKIILRLVGKSGVVLDLGCLDGTIGFELIKLGNKVYGIDASKKSVELACEKGIRAFVGDLESPLDLSYASSFDVVVAGEIIEHIYQVNNFLDEIYKVLKPTGYLVLSTPNLASLGRRLMLLLGINPHIEVTLRTTPNYTPGGHIRYFVKSTLFNLLNEHGFEIVEFTSDVINLNEKGSLGMEYMAKLFPTFGRSLIVRAKKK